MRIALALVFVVSAVVLMPLAASAQQTPKMPRIGLLSVGSDPSRPLSPQWLAFLDGLRALGYVEGQNVMIERRFAAGKSERVAGMASELVQLGVDIIVATGLRENQAARQATRTIPIVMVVVDDPVEAGFVESLARPGGNVTGLAFSTTGIGEKYVELLGQAVLSVKRMAVVASRSMPPGLLKEMQGAARTARVLSSASGARPHSWTGSSRARSRLICPSSSRRSSSWYSMSRRRRLLGSRSRLRFSPAPTRSFSDPRRR